MQNLNLRHIYLIRFLFLALFFARLASKFEKSANMTYKNESKKVLNIPSLTNMSKSRKRAYFTFLKITFLVPFFRTFSTDLKSV